MRFSKNKCACLSTTVLTAVLAGLSPMTGCAHSDKPFIALGRPANTSAPSSVSNEQLAVFKQQPAVGATTTSDLIAATATSPTTLADSTTSPTTVAATTGPMDAAPLVVQQPIPQPPVVQPTTSAMPMVVPPVATSALGSVTVVPGLAPKAKPFIAVPKALQISGGHPSTLLLEHASPDSPVPLTDFANQPAHSVGDFHLRANLSADEVQSRLGSPAQLADTEDPWFVYRLHGEQEIWLHFTGPLLTHLDAADVIRGAEDGYVRDRVFSDDK